MRAFWIPFSFLFFSSVAATIDLDNAVYQRLDCLDNELTGGNIKKDGEKWPSKKILKHIDKEDFMVHLSSDKNITALLENEDLFNELALAISKDKKVKKTLMKKLGKNKPKPQKMTNKEVIQMVLNEHDSLKLVFKLVILAPMILFTTFSVIFVASMFGCCYPCGLNEGSSSDGDKNKKVESDKKAKSNKKSKEPTSKEKAKKKKKTAETEE